MKYDFDCVVIGAGIAGMTAAMYLKRANVNVLIIDKDAPGGALNRINKIENYPGYESISGPDLAYKLYEQIAKLNVEIRYGNVLDIKEHVIVTDIENISANKIILAVGRSIKRLDNTSGLINVSYCATCDANLYKNKVVALLVSNIEAIDEALYLADICKKVLVINKENDIELLKKLQEKENIEIYNNCIINTLKSENNLLKSLETNQGVFEIDGMFVALGTEPKQDFLNEIEKENGYIIVNNKMQTNIDYIYACGDIIKKDVYQLTTAVGEASIAALNVKKTLK